MDGSWRGLGNFMAYSRSSFFLTPFSTPPGGGAAALLICVFDSFSNCFSLFYFIRAFVSFLNFFSRLVM